MLPHPDPPTSSSSAHSRPSHPASLILPFSLAGPLGWQDSLMNTSSTPSSSERAPTAVKRARTVSISQRTDDDDPDQQETKKKKTKGKAKAMSVDVKDEDRDEKEKNRTGKACLNCRRQKMKCEGGDDPPCGRCKASGVDCIFKPRANAAILVDDAHWQEMVERRLGSLEKDMRSVHNRVPSSPTRSLSGTSLANAGPSTSALRQQQRLSFDTVPQPSPTRPSFGSGVYLPSTFESPPSAEGLLFAPMPPPSAVAPLRNQRIQSTDRSRNMADALGLTLQGLQDCRTGLYEAGGEVDMTALTLEAVLECWEHFHATIAPQLWSFSLPPSPRPSMLFLASILATATLLHPVPDISALHQQTVHLLDLALSDLVTASVRLRAQHSSDQERSLPTGYWDDIVGLCIAVTWLVGPEQSSTGGNTPRGDVLMALAWRLATDKCRATGSPVDDEARKRVWELVQITETFQCSLALSQPLLLATTPPPHLANVSSASPPLFQAVSAASGLMRGLVSTFSSRSFPSVVQLVAMKEQGEQGQRRDAMGYQDEVVVTTYKTEVDEWAKKWLGIVASSSLGTSAFVTTPDPTALSFLVLIYHCAILLGSTLQQCKADGPTTEDDASILATSRALLHVLSTNAEFANKAGRMPITLLVYLQFASLIVIEAVIDGRTSRDDLLLPQTLLASLQTTCPPPDTPQAHLLTSLSASLTTATQTPRPAPPTTPFDSQSMFPPPTPHALNDIPSHQHQPDQQHQADFFASMLGGGTGLSRPATPLSFGLGDGVGTTSFGFPELQNEQGLFEGDAAFPTYLHTNFSSEAGYGTSAGAPTWPPAFIPGARAWGGGGGSGSGGGGGMF